MDNTLPKICTAPFSSVLIDVNKNIKPCNQYAEGPLRNIFQEPIRDKIIPGNLNNNSLEEILNNRKYEKLREKMYTDKIPKGCSWCLSREKETGFSQRQSFMPPDAPTFSNNKNTSYNGRLYYEDWYKGVTVLEIDTSNVCNLTCAGCDSFFSSAWAPIEKSIKETDHNRFYMHRKVYRNVPISFPMGDILITNLSQIDLTYLKRVIFKGGEPFLNPDMLLVLEYLDKINILSQTEIGITTNGTILNEKIVMLLNRAKRVEIVLSIDGPEEVNNYIRYSSSNFSALVNLINFCNQFQLPSTTISMMPTIMVYNVFSLDKLLDWWLFIFKLSYDNAGAKEYIDQQSKTMIYPAFYSSHFLRNKSWLTLSTLQPVTINRLIEYYEEKSNDPKYIGLNDNSAIKSHSTPFENLIYVLKNTKYGGDILHDQMVKYTKDMDKIKGQNILDVVPELEEEMVYLTHYKGRIPYKKNPIKIFYSKLKNIF